jgi:hypothetical protein
MERWFDAAAVLLLAGATGLIALHARGYFASDSPDVPNAVPEESYAARVAAALPHLERHVANGSMRSRQLACDERDTLAEIAEIEAAIGPADDPALSIPLSAGIAALRACVACKPDPTGCADAARAFAFLEERLALPRGANGI